MANVARSATRTTSFRIGDSIPPPDYGYALGAYEADRRKLLAACGFDGEIAEELVISLATVKTHIRHLLQKLGVRDRVQVVVLAHEHGVV